MKVWTPVHNEVKGSKVADKLARIGAKTTFIAQEPFFVISNNTRQKKLNDSNTTLC